jgi:hypothetical protein
MASGTADLQRDLGGAIMQSVLGALLTAGYATAFARAIGDAPNGAEISDDVETALQSSFASAEAVAEQYPQYATQIVDAARESFVSGQNWAYGAGVLATVVGAVLVFVAFPRHAEEEELLTAYATADAGPARPG